MMQLRLSRESELEKQQHEFVARPLPDHDLVTFQPLTHVRVKQ
jgi:hypothetical protein